MAQAAPRGAAASRCPAEIWHTILRFATHVTPRYPWSDPLDPDVICGGKAEERMNLMLTQRRGSVAVARRLIEVCRSWRDFVYPFIYEWTEICNNDEMMPLLAASYRGCLNATFVRSLWVFVSPRSGLLEDPATENKLFEVIRKCSGLEEFIWDADVHRFPRAVVPTLLDTCAGSLYAVHLPYNSNIHVGTFAEILARCPNLTALSVAGMPDDKYPPVIFPTRPLALRTLSCEVSEDNVGWMDMAASMQLPDLRDLHIQFYFDDEEVKVPEVALFIRTHGETLKSLVIQSGGLAFLLIEHCPNLEELIFDIPDAAATYSFPRHGALRRVGCRQFEDDYIRYNFDLLFRGTADLEAAEASFAAHAEKINRFFRRLCEADMPSLCAIRIMDAVCPINSTSVAALQRDGHVLRPYHVLGASLSELCAARHIRLEDRLGTELSRPFWPSFQGPRYDYNASSERQEVVDAVEEEKLEEEDGDEWTLSVREAAALLW